MDEYQEALDNLIKVSCPKKVCCNECDINKMCNCDAKEYINTLQELVDKSTPKKIIIKDIKCSYIKFRIYCPTCGKIVDRTNNPYGNMLDVKYCDQCGQKLDWSDEDVD